MKKFTTFAVAALLVMVLVASLSGCGGGTKQAQVYMNAGDQLFKKLQSTAAAFIKEAGSINLSDPTQVDAKLSKLKTDATDVSNQADAVIAEYKKVKSLNGVADYVKYTDLQIQFLDTFKELVNKEYTSLEKLGAMVKSGDMSNASALDAQYKQEVNTLLEKMNKIGQEADKLKTDKNL
jgi:hypothetical protein